jgi:putative ABC transport system permease protein
MAIGAQRSDVLGMVGGNEARRSGISARRPDVFALTRALSSLLFAVSAADPPTLAWVTLLFCGMSFAAILVPARRAATIDSLALLRTD